MRGLFRVTVARVSSTYYLAPTTTMRMPIDPISPDDVELTGDVSSLLSLANQASPRTLDLLGFVGNHMVYILIDNGATHNFIQPSVVE